MDKSILQELAAIERKSYFKAWRAANKDKTAQHRKTYWEKKVLAKLAVQEKEGGGGNE